ncbi:hypothetical protein E1281_01070 [Actinomadura sp. KC345]|nr:hypothetical protein E1281_01070 [Actinomadura sp. KC345]
MGLVSGLADRGLAALHALAVGADPAGHGLGGAEGGVAAAAGRRLGGVLLGHVPFSLPVALAVALTVAKRIGIAQAVALW